MNNEYHIPALLVETVDGLNIKPNGIYVDATFGGGGHSSEILKRLKTGKLIAFDQDTDAHKNTLNSKNFVLIKSNFKFISNFLNYLKIEKVDGILADLGLSTHHIDEPQRGFSFRFDAPLDMRMNTSQELDANYIINNYSEKQLFELLKNYGELDNAKNIATNIIMCRKEKSIETTFDFVSAVKKFAPKNDEHKFFAKIFQAVRIEVNAEIQTLKDFLTSIPNLLNINARVAIISYHSLEDKIVKDFFKTGNFDGKRITDMYGNVLRNLTPINNKVIIPTDQEIEKNNRVRSAKLRIAEKLGIRNYEL